MRPTLTKHPKFRRLCAMLGIPPPLAVGCLELLWEVAYESGEPIIGDALDVELAAQWPGERGVFTQAVVDCGGSGCAGFVDVLEDGRYAIHDLFDHAPDYVTARATREAARRAKGLTISQLRSEAGKRGAEARWDGKRMANADQVPSGDGKRMANAIKTMANEATPAPAPKETTSLPASAATLVLVPDDPPKPPKKATDPNVAKLIAHYSAEFQRIFKAKPTIHGGKDGQAAKALLSGRTFEEAASIVTQFIACPPPWNEQNHAYDLAHIAQKVNTILSRRTHE